VLGDLGVELALLLGVALALENVAEVRPEAQLQRQCPRFLAVVLDHQVLVDAVCDEAVAADRDGRIRTVSGACQRADDTSRVVVDAGAGEHVNRLLVDEQLPPREMAHVGVEEPLGAPELDVSARGREKVGAAVHEREIPTHSRQANRRPAGRDWGDELERA
jgi:PAS domain-containing protein